MEFACCITSERNRRDNGEGTREQKVIDFFATRLDFR